MSVSVKKVLVQRFLKVHFLYKDWPWVTQRNWLVKHRSKVMVWVQSLKKWLLFLVLHMYVCVFLQRVSIACYAKRCITYRKSVRPSVCLSVCPSVSRWHCVKTTPATIMLSSLEDSPITLVSSRLTLPRNSKGNIGSEGAKWERGRKNRQFLANKWP